MAGQLAAKLADCKARWLQGSLAARLVLKSEDVCVRPCVFFAAQLVTEALEAREGGAKDTDRGPQTGDSGVSTLSQLRAFFDTHQMIVECSTILSFAFCLPNHTALSGLQPTCATQRFFRTTMRT